MLGVRRPMFASPPHFLLPLNLPAVSLPGILDLPKLPACASPHPLHFDVRRLAFDVRCSMFTSPPLSMAFPAHITRRLKSPPTAPMPVIRDYHYRIVSVIP